MSTLFARIRSLVTAQAHHRLDTLEDPNVMAAQLLRELAEQLQQARHALVVALGGEKQLAQQRERVLREAQDWERHAERFLREGDEARAREAVTRGVQLRARAEALLRPLEAARRAVERRRERLQQLQTEFETARHRVAIIRANHTAATVLGEGAGDAYTRAMERAEQLDRYTEKAERLEAEAEAAADLLREEGRLEREAATLDLQAEVEAQMTALRARLQPAAGSPDGAS